MVDSCEGRCLVLPCTTLHLVISDSNIGITSSLETAVSVKVKEENLLRFDKDGERFKGVPFLMDVKKFKENKGINIPTFV